MENLNNVDDPNNKPHPKPTDDPGAQIETVTPDSQKESLPNDKTEANEKVEDESVKDNEEVDSSEEEEVVPEESNGEQEADDVGTGIETVTPS
ncbi:MAG: hypothetical protein WC623_18360 [Pedobacter sp.]|uniref:hypothetical protein n=1 Tax=Pedobacter sp. TaxID=1411316 RepID=UPI00356A3A79